MADAHAHHHHAAPDKAPDVAPGTTVAAAIDPVCGMRVDPATSKHRFEHAGEAFYFCCARCRERFSADPASFLHPKPAADPPAEGVGWE